MNANVGASGAHARQSWRWTRIGTADACKDNHRWTRMNTHHGPCNIEGRSSFADRRSSHVGRLLPKATAGVVHVQAPGGDTPAGSCRVAFGSSQRWLRSQTGLHLPARGGVLRRPCDGPLAKAPSSQRTQGTRTVSRGDRRDRGEGNTNYARLRARLATWSWREEAGRCLRQASACVWIDFPAFSAGSARDRFSFLCELGAFARGQTHGRERAR